MTIIQGILLGILQGVTEFLPVSSSGHLAVAQNLFGLGEVPLLFDVFLHLATLCAVVIYFRRQIWLLLCAFGRWISRKPIADDAEKANRMTVLAIILATVVTGVIGVFTAKFIPDLSIKYVCAGFLVTAVLLVLSSLLQKMQEKTKDVAVESASASCGISWKQALIIGLAQGVGTLPGISRSGSTISGALLSGVDRVKAGEFSFIVSIPAILGAFVLELKDIHHVGASVGAEPVIAGCAAAFAVGYISLVWLMRLIRKGKLEWFAAYLVPLGILGLIFLK